MTRHSGMTIGLFAHVDAGKTTFAEQLLYHNGAIRRRGRVDHRDAYLDSHDIERARGITVFADQASFAYEGRTYDLIDTPGHVDFSSEMERAVQVMDAAIVIVSAVEGVQGHTETVWQLLRDRGVPTFFFLNKIDRTGADVSRVAGEIRELLTGDLCDITAGMREDGSLTDELLALLAEREERLLELYMEGRTSEADAGTWRDAMRTMVREGRIHPYGYGSALQDVGVADFFAKLHALTGAAYDPDGPFAARVYKIRHEPSGTRVTYAKAIGGTLAVREEIAYTPPGAEAPIREKATQLRRVSGGRFAVVDRIEAGQLFAVVGLSAAAVGGGLGALAASARFETMPSLVSKVEHDPAVPAKDVLARFRMLEAEDPLLGVEWEERQQEIRIRVMGAIQLEVLEQLALERFGLRVTFGPPDILYMETIAAGVVGSGHFEPLGHYAEVHLRLEPGAPGSGIAYASECHPDMLPVPFQHLVRQHVFERPHRGILTGSPLTDVKITLLRGKAHNKHTSGGDFREATFRAIRQGLEKADNRLLEPVYDVRIRVQAEHLGRVLADLQQAHGRFEPPQLTERHAEVYGRVPVATFMDYPAAFAAFTHGKGAIRLAFGGYEPCHNTDEVMRARAYRKDADPLYTSSSIFCAKGAGFSVPWDEADGYMHV